MPFLVFLFLQMLMNVNSTLVKMGVSAQIWLQTIPVNAQGNIWEETVSTVSKCSCFYGCFIPAPLLSTLCRFCINWILWQFIKVHSKVLSQWVRGEACKGMRSHAHTHTHTHILKYILTIQLTQLSHRGVFSEQAKTVKNKLIYKKWNKKIITTKLQKNNNDTRIKF